MAGVERVAQQNADLIPFIREEESLREARSAPENWRSPSSAIGVSWGWNWSRVKTVLEWLFMSAKSPRRTATRNSERVYDSARASYSELRARHADSIATGFGDWSDPAGRKPPRHSRRVVLRDYFRTRRDMTRVAITTLVENGELIPVLVDGSGNGPWYPWHRPGAPSDQLLVRC